MSEAKLSLDGIPAFGRAGPTLMENMHKHAMRFVPEIVYDHARSAKLQRRATRDFTASRPARHHPLLLQAQTPC